MKTILMSRDKAVDQFAMVHDSFGTCAGDVEILHKSTKEAFLWVYAGRTQEAAEGGVLGVLRDQWQAQLEKSQGAVEGAVREVSMPNPPELGDWAPDSIMNADYFFC